MKRYLPRTLSGRLGIILVIVVSLGVVLAGFVVYWLVAAVLQSSPDSGAPLGLEQRLPWILALACLLIAAAIAALGYALVRRFFKPLDNLVLEAEKITHGELRRRTVDPTAPEEIQQLVGAYNQIAERMQANINEMRSFVAYASHELRTPLTSIKLRVEALRNGALEDPPVTDRFLSEIESEVDRLSRMVNDLLDLSRIEAGLEVSELIPLNLLTITSDVYESYRVRADRAGVDLTYDADPDLPMILGEEDQLRRMIYNLVDNAIKYTPREGKVSLALHRGASPEKIELIVQDTGFGISKEHLPHIFERFYRVEATRPRYGPPQGSGLGLAIARTIVEAHGGKIWVTSKLGQGTAFRVEFPVLNGLVN